MLWVKPLIMAVALQFTCTQIAMSEPTDAKPSEGQLAAARELMDVTGVKARYASAIEDQIALIEQQIKRAMPEVDQATIDLLNDIARDEFSKGVPGLFDKTIEIYSRHFSESDMRGLIAFYRTDSGKHFVSEMPVITKECSEAGAEIAGNILIRFKAELAKRKASGTPP